MLKYSLLVIILVVQVNGEDCPLGKYGETCDDTCNHNCAPSPTDKLVHCHKLTGKCSEGCNRGWHGDKCDRKCSKNCLKSVCNVHTGTCIECEVNYSGKYCETYKDVGVYGNVEQCNLGTFGVNCTQVCPKGCEYLQNGTGYCDKYTGKCSQGCNSGWHSDFCNETCSANCFNRLCEQERGHCVLGCMGTHTGEFCEETQGTTDRERILLSAILVSTVTVIAIIAVIVAITICTRRKSQDAEEPPQETIDFIPKPEVVIHEKENINTDLHEACKKEDMDQITNLLVEHDINSIDENKRTPIMVAELYGKNNIVDLLLGKGADLSQEDKDGFNILHLACMNGHVQIAELVLRPDNVNRRGPKGLTPVMIAADHGYVDMVEILVRNGADVLLEDAVGNNILHSASRKGHLETVKYILTQGMVSIDSRGHYQLTPVMMAAEHGHKAVVELFVEREADLSLVDEFRNTILHRACRGGYLPTVEYILSKTKHCIFTRNGKGRTPVMEAEYKGHAMVVTFLKAEM